MNAILTLNIDENVVEKAETYAKASKKTVSQLVEEYLLSISTKRKIDTMQLEPITSQIAGIIKLDENNTYNELLTDVLMEKYL